MGFLFNYIDITPIIISPQVNLSELRGQHVLVMFYPVDFGYVTPTEFYSLAPLLPDLSDMNCTMLAISTEHISSQMKSQITPRSAPRSPHTLTNILWFTGLRLGWTYLG